MSARISIERPSPVHDRLEVRRVLTCVTANTNTRSQSSSAGPVERSVDDGISARSTGESSVGVNLPPQSSPLASSAQRAVADPVARARAEGRRTVVGVGELAALE